MKTFTSSSSKNIVYLSSLLGFIRFSTGYQQDKSQPAAYNYLEFILWCKEAASSR